MLIEFFGFLFNIILGTIGHFLYDWSNNNKIIGSVGVYKLNDSTCELRKMYLYKEYQGKSIGKTLLKNALEAAKSLGYTTMTLQTNSLLTKALPLYKSFGFKENNDEVCSRCDISMEKDIRTT